MDRSGIAGCRSRFEGRKDRDHVIKSREENKRVLNKVCVRKETTCDHGSRRAAISLTIERACLSTNWEEADKENQTPKKRNEVFKGKEERERDKLETKEEGERSKTIFEEGEEDERRTYLAELA
ncbi:hypothetical protein RhiirA5_385905 [Rhizophagus irregularis]|uniref:Uncharacterized protein n=1 Tax=Rhizophagus irregularis TaxID=588596 RepID=A0A2N0NLY5_9GLOM|nr:hypothetical protein RhiirA5_385905 [Rhizophagus irregularis]